MKTKIPIKKYVMNEALSWEERYRQLEKHHEEETKFLIGRIEELEKLVKHYSELAGDFGEALNYDND